MVAQEDSQGNWIAFQNTQGGPLEPMEVPTSSPRHGNSFSSFLPKYGASTSSPKNDNDSTSAASPTKQGESVKNSRRNSTKSSRRTSRTNAKSKPPSSSSQPRGEAIVPTLNDVWSSATITTRSDSGAVESGDINTQYPKDRASASVPIAAMEPRSNLFRHHNQHESHSGGSDGGSRGAGTGSNHRKSRSSSSRRQASSRSYDMQPTTLAETKPTTTTTTSTRSGRRNKKLPPSAPPISTISLESATKNRHQSRKDGNPEDDGDVDDDDHDTSGGGGEKRSAVTKRQPTTSSTESSSSSNYGSQPPDSEINVDNHERSRRSSPASLSRRRGRSRSRIRSTKRTTSTSKEPHGRKKSSGSGHRLPPTRKRSGSRSRATRGRSADRTQPNVLAAKPRSQSRARSIASAPKERSMSRESSTTAERRAKSRSRPPTASSTRGRSKSRSALPSRSLERSTSDQRLINTNTAKMATERRGRSSSRPPRTTAPVGKRGRSESRGRPHAAGAASRSRSMSLTRVTNPNAIHPKIRAGPSYRPPPSTSRTRREMKLGGSGCGSASIGSSTRRRVRAPSEDGESSLSSFGPAHDLSSSSSSLRIDRHNRKGTLLERLFGDHVNRSANFAYEYRPRILLAATVYQNTATNLWITTINTNQRGVAKNPTLANKFLKAFSFPTEREARESAIANAPPKMVAFNESNFCFNCKGKFAVFRRASHCRNCGVCVCGSCTTTWAAKMLPATYNLKNEAVLKICLSCDSLSAAFKKALIDGDYDQAVSLYETGNVNLRTPFAVMNKKDEVMYPIHCAVEGGNLDILRWLIDDHFCPIKLIRAGGAKNKSNKTGTDVPILTSRGRSVLGIAIERVKVDIMRYLVADCGISIYENVDLQFSLRALEAALVQSPPPSPSSHPSGVVPGFDRGNDRRSRAGCHEVGGHEPRWDKASFDEMSEPSSLGVDDVPYDDVATVGSRSNRTIGSKSNQRSVKTNPNADSCIICFDRKIDCVATPCGHQVCCLECSKNLSACPVCNNRGDFIKIFRP